MRTEVVLAAVNTIGLGVLLVKPYVHVARKPRGGIILDSCALIDGRIVDVHRAGFVHEPLIVPHFVLRELQTLADGHDNQKRARARMGLEAAEALLSSNNATVDTSLKNADKTDELLLELAKKRAAWLCTTDYNLLKVAAAEGVKTMNINELSQAIRSNLVPGDEQTVRIVQKGDGRGQGVGYLQDGTMIVVAQAADKIGSLETVVIERSLQTVSGRMAFAHIKAANQTARRFTKRA